eukprot:jgi/Mesvir1/7927/Mv11849-RA.1
MAAGASRFVVAIDFGTTYSGFAYCRRDNSAEIFVRYDWDDQVEFCTATYCKTLSALYYENGAFSPAPSWGWPAVRKHFDDPNGARRLVTCFKLLLADDAQRGAMSSPALIPDERAFATAAGVDWAVRLPVGKSAEDCVADYLRALSGVAMKDIRSRFGHQVTEGDIQWCLTVPAIWDEAAKAAMIRAAAKAGMVKMSAAGPGSGYAPLLILEPEAASLYAFKTLRDGDLRNAKVAMVVDAGGGTVDIVVHELQTASGDPQMREVCRGSGNLCGGVFVDRAFEGYLSMKIPCYPIFKQRFPRQAAKLLTEFERHKRTFRGQPANAWVLDLPSTLARMRADGQWPGSNRADDFDALEISCQDMKMVFSPVVDKTLHMMEKMLEAAGKPCDTIILAGGLSASPYLFARIKEKFGHRVQRIVRPPDPGSAVVQGAVLFGLNPDTLLSRVSRRSYGVETCAYFDDSKHPADKKVVIEGKTLCNDSFLCFVKAGEHVPVGKAVVHSVYPVYHDQDGIVIPIWSTLGSPPLLVTEWGMHKEGELVVSTPDTWLGKRRKYLVSFFFGKAQFEVQVRGENCKTLGELSKSFVFSRLGR